RYPALREIVGPNPLTAVAGADLRLAVRRAGGVKGGALLLIHAGAQDFHRLGAVLVLAALLLHRHDDAGREVGDAHRAVGLVDVLTAGARRAIDVDPQVALVDLHV